jgi:hypothetical protein
MTSKTICLQELSQLPINVSWMNWKLNVNVICFNVVCPPKNGLSFNPIQQLDIIFIFRFHPGEVMAPDGLIMMKQEALHHSGKGVPLG